MFLQRCMMNCWCLNTMKYDVIDDVYDDKWIDVVYIVNWWMSMLLNVIDELYA
jgi:hypothetical protein